MNLNKQILESIQRGINLAIDDFNDNMDIEAQKVGQIKNSYNTKDLIIDKYFVDLGLPSGTLWGKYNIGATNGNTPESWYGNYYAWGEIKEKQDYSWKTYKYANDYHNKLTKYCNDARYCNNDFEPDNLTTLQDEDDVAVQTNKLPLNIKMPTEELIDELLKYTINKWVKNYQCISGLNGRVFISKNNDNETFIPAAGYWTGSSAYYVGLYCDLWSCSLYLTTPDSAYYFGCYSSECWLSASYRSLGFSVRPVIIK